MIRKILLMMVGVCLVALLAVGMNSSMEKKSEVRGVINDLNGLVDETVRVIGDVPTIEGISEAQKIVDGRKDFISGKIKSLRDSGKLKGNAENALEFEIANERNGNKLAVIYDKFAEKSDEDIKTLNRLAEKLNQLSLSSREYKATEKELNEHTNVMKTTANLKKAMDSLVISYQSIIEK